MVNVIYSEIDWVSDGIVAVAGSAAPLCRARMQPARPTTHDQAPGGPSRDTRQSS